MLESGVARMAMDVDIDLYFVFFARVVYLALA